MIKLLQLFIFDFSVLKAHKSGVLKTVQKTDHLISRSILPPEAVTSRHMCFSKRSQT